MWLHGQLSLRFCRESFNSSDFFLAIFQLSPRQFNGGYKCDFDRAQATRQNLKKVASPARAKNRSCSCGLRGACFENKVEFLKKMTCSFNIILLKKYVETLV